MKTLIKCMVLGNIGGIIYVLIELIYRQYSHISMYFLGGVCFLLIGLLNENLSWNIPLWQQSMLGSVIITIAEFIAGCILNLLLGLNIWSYAELPFNILGQVCLPFSVVWIFLSLVAIVVDDYLRYWLFNEDKPQYKI